MRIAFFGLPLAALLLADDGHDIVLVASPRRDAIGNRRARRRFGERFLLQPRGDDPALQRRVRDAGAELLVSWFWTKRLPMKLVRSCPLGGFGVHPSLLPRHRGPDPYFWAIERGDRETGVTAHRIAEDYDTGAILGHRTLAVDPAWNAWQLAKALDRPSLRLLRDVAGAFARGEPPAEVAQDDALATDAPEPDEELTALRLASSTESLLRRIRALAPSPGAELELGDAVVTVTRAERAERFPASLEPGEAYVDEGGRAVVRTGDGAIALLSGIRTDDESEAPLDAAAFALLLSAEMMLAFAGTLSPGDAGRMSDPNSQAKQARETLARALGALQSDPSVPPQLMNVAEPVSQAMGALFQIERTGSLATATAARDHVRAALGLLQAAGVQHAAVTTAMESVAGSLGLVFSLVKMAEAAPAAAPQPAYQAPAQPAPQAYQPPPQQPAAQPAPQAYQPPPQQPAPQAYQPPPQQAAPAPQAYQPPAQQAAPAPAPAAAAPAGTARFEASLGTNSPTNFYKGLSGNDVVEHGGIFVATYAKAPKVGANVALRVTLPGGYEFEVLGVVSWTRDQRGGDGDMLPGFGARITQIAPEAKQLIYRYVRNREPLFHDDF
jgi:methionyl-tRNA formyltransferase